MLRHRMIKKKNPSYVLFEWEKIMDVLSTCKHPGCIITNIRPTKSLRLILGLISDINLAEIKLKD